MIPLKVADKTDTFIRHKKERLQPGLKRDLCARAHIRHKKGNMIFDVIFYVIFNEKSGIIFDLPILEDIRLNFLLEL